MTAKRLMALSLVLILSIACAVYLSATVNEVTARNDYTANGSTTAFAYGFRVLTKTDIEVLVNGVTKTVDTDYTVSGLGASSGGTVTFLVAPANGLKVALLRKQPAQQTSIYQANQPLSATRLEQDLDKLQMQVQQLKEQLQRIPAFEKKSLLKDKVLPDFGAGKFLKVTDAGTGLEWVTPVTVGTLNVPSFTTGSVPFATGTATLGQDNANLFWDDGNNRLGIGTATPAEPLDVIGNAKVGGTLSVTGASTLAAVAMSGTSSSIKTCATGYTRVLPNYCRKNAATTESWTDATTCTSRTFSAAAPAPADAKLLYLAVIGEGRTNNAVATLLNFVDFFAESACTNVSARAHFWVREWNATTAGTKVSEQMVSVIVPATGTNTFHTTQNNAGGNGNVDVAEHRAMGYFD